MVKAIKIYYFEIYFENKTETNPLSYLPRLTLSPRRRAEEIVVMTRIIGVDMAKKTGPFFLMTHVWREYVTPVATIPCIKYYDFIWYYWFAKYVYKNGEKNGKSCQSKF